MALLREKTFTGPKETVVLQAMKERKYQLPVALFDVREVNVLVLRSLIRTYETMTATARRTSKKQ